MRINILFIFFCIVGLFLGNQKQSYAQPQSPYVQILIQPTNNTWDYEVGEEVNLKVTILKNQIPIEGVSIHYEYGLEGMEAEEKGTTVATREGEIISIGTMLLPGLKRCIVNVNIDDTNYSSIMTVAYSPHDIEPTINNPSDFDEFWQDAIDKMRQSQSKVQQTVLDEHSTSTTEVSLLKFNVPNSEVSFYGYLSKPKKKGKYPIVLALPGAGIGPSGPMVNFVDENIITLSIEIHGLNPQGDAEFYKEVRNRFLNYMYSGVESRDKFYYKSVVLNCIKAADYLCELPEYDEENFITFGGSQGGFLSIATAALDKRVTGVVSFHPAMSDLTGYLYERVGGWPHYFAPKFDGIYTQEAIVETLSYFDTVNFAKRLRVPGFYSFGYNDVTCPATTCFAVVNAIEAPKELFLTPITGHWRISEMMAASSKWIQETVNK